MGLAGCGVCGRKVAPYYQGPHQATPGYYCTGTGQLVDGRGTRHLRVGGVAIDAAVTQAFLAALAPAALQACLAAAQQLEDGHDTALAQWRRQAEHARYRAGHAERRYRAVDPDNRLVARGLETDWEQALTDLAAAEAELARETARPKTLTAAEKTAILALGDDLDQVWAAPTTTDKDRKQLLRALLEEVNISLTRDTPTPTPSWCCGGRAAPSATCPCRSNGNRPRSAPRRTPSPSAGGWRRTAPTPPSPGSSTGRAGAPPGNCPLPPIGSSRCATTGASPATSPATTARTPPERAVDHDDQGKEQCDDASKQAWMSASSTQ